MIERINQELEVNDDSCLLLCLPDTQARSCVWFTVHQSQAYRTGVSLVQFLPVQTGLHHCRDATVTPIFAVSPCRLPVDSFSIN